MGITFAGLAIIAGCKIGNRENEYKHHLEVPSITTTTHYYYNKLPEECIGWYEFGDQNNFKIVREDTDYQFLHITTQVSATWPELNKFSKHYGRFNFLETGIGGGW
ncbi:MAG: hypothetical protein ACOYT4_02275 [Nanoarchaeota archaeon]